MCKAERGKRKLVATSPEDARFREEKFVGAVAICANQDIQCHVGKQRAVQWVKERGEQLLWVAARDRPCHGGEQRRPYTVEDNIRWLGYHEKECASLPGWLPMAKGMPVALGDHLDRSKKQLLRGRHATIHGWVLHEDEVVGDEEEEVLSHLPRVIVLDFHTKEWHLPGWEPGLYPIFPSKGRQWFLDGYRKHPVLGVKRTQFMITPALAITAHAAQGRTLGAVIADLERGRGVSWMSSYVAITRVRRRENLLIFRPFDRKPYNEGEMAGTKKLLEVLRGEDVDWEDWEAQLMPRDECGRCRRRLLEDAFTK